VPDDDEGRMIEIVASEARQREIAFECVAALGIILIELPLVRRPCLDAGFWHGAQFIRRGMS
jgi:hypothetical protein